jgi:hypothetical protein
MPQENQSGIGASAPANSPIPDNGPVPHARMTREGESITFTPVRPGQDQIESYPLCQMPKSLGEELASTCMWFWHRHRRCLGILLFLEPQRRRWTAVIPTQRCARDSSCWSACQRDVPADHPASVLMGSFQSRVLASDEEAQDCPPHDGLHLVLRVGVDQPIVTGFLRCEGQTHRVAASDILFDDIGHAIESAIDRLKFV